MGQANSRGAAEAQRRPPRPRPRSWAPGLRASPPPPQQHQHEQQQQQQQQQQQPDHDDTVPELVHRRPTQHAHDTPSRPRTSSTRLSNRLSAHFGRHDAGPSAPEEVPPPSRSRSRLRFNRARSSLTSMAGLLHRRPSLQARSTEPAPDLLPPHTPARSTPSRSALRHTASEQGPVLPRVQLPDLGLDFDQLLRTNSHAERPDTHRQRPLVPLSPLRRDGRTLSILPSQRRLRNMIGHQRRRRPLWQDGENMDNAQQLRQGEDQADVLSRLLSLAAAATAASLVGEDNPDATRDGTFDTFLQSLQNGSIASALRGNDDGAAGDTPGASQPPLNFFRMFRFSTGADNGSRGTSSGNGQADGDQDGEGRLVPIIIVGIRSIQPGSSTGQEDASIPPFLDALSSFPTPPTSPGDANASIIQPPQNGTRFSHRRRASMGGFNFPSNYDSQRHHRANTQDHARPWSSVTDSPPGPLPPPSTPATTLNFSSAPSGATTPATSTSPPSPTTQSSAPSRRNSFVPRGAGSTLEPTAEEPQTYTRNARPRRLSESDFTRYGSGAPRRRGVVEPDNNPGEGSRSWIIYVLGGSYPENHPILTTPSLFTDSPTYEDMMLLSSILGPAKPPVASEEDVASAPGLLTIRGTPGALTAETVEGEETIDLVPGARCLVCLCDFEVDDEARKLVKCEHMFHKICIDQWLTTGRNSCPLCRGEGVHETAKETDTPPDTATPSIPQAAA
ncbi:ring finger domain-containing protein [Stemphylium lycopersici]|uniref:Ring finger domain-containing protein n=1 Tax=Stemphylium lycopersici TaxID=183478 RepID=A0A364N1S6_STELY|nr:ring finger domain-containing protein [Stemphylium lycopersici]